MRHFIFTYSENTRKAHCERTVTLHRLVRNKPILVGRATEIFMGKEQIVMQLCERYKALPKAAFERHEVSHMPKHTFWSLKRDGIAIFTEV